MPDAVDEQYKAQMEKPDLVFLTKENEESMKGVIDEKVLEAKKEELDLKTAEMNAPRSLPVREETSDAAN